VSEGILLRFLENGLIDVGGDDVKFEKLSATSQDLAEVLTKSPAKSVPFALIAFDPEAPTSDPVVLEAMEALKKRWSTYMNTFSGVPVTIVRAMLLDALTKAAAEDEKVAIGFVASARNVLPFIEIGSEGTIWREVVTRIEGNVDKRAEAEWATPSAISVDKLKFSKSSPIQAKTNGATVKRDWLLGRISAATGPTGENPNPYWPNNPQPWAQQFASRMSDAIAEAIDSVAAAYKIEPIDFRRR
jgi:hypothetical protein